MKNLTFAILFLLAMICSGFSAEWVNVHTDGSTASESAEVTSVKNGNVITINMSTRGYWKSEVSLNGETYTEIAIPGLSGKTSEIGSPKLPTRVFTFEIPSNASVVTAAVQMATSELTGVQIAPVQPPFIDAGVKYEDPEFTKNQETYEQTSLYPESNVVDYKIVKMRDFNLLYVTVTPVQVLPASKNVVISNELRIDIEISSVYTDAFRSLSTDESGLSRSNAFTRMTKSGTDETPAMRTMTVDATSPVYAPEKYMILIDDALLGVTEFDEFVEWKTKKGYDVRIVTTSEINSNGAPTHAEIVTFMRGLSDAEYPSYLLIVGSEDRANGVEPLYQPAWNYPGNIDEKVTDAQIACRDSRDEIPDLFYGRIPSSNKTEIATAFTKILKIDRNPVGMTNFNRVLVAGELQNSNNDGYADRRFAETATAIQKYFESKSSNTVLSAISSSSTNITENLQWANYSMLWNQGSTIGAEVANLIKSSADGIVAAKAALDGQGVAFVQHRDHGWIGGWGQPGINRDDIRDLDIEQFPLILSVNCLTGAYQTSSRSFMESALFDVDNVDLSSARGAYSVFAATDLSGSAYNDVLTHGMYIGFDDTYRPVVNSYTEIDLPVPGPSDVLSTEFSLVEGSATKLGAMLHFAKMYLLSVEGTNAGTYTHLGIYHLYGDPEMDMVFDAPEALTVSAPASVNTENGATVSISFGKADLQVCIYNKESGFQQVAYTNTTGEVTFSVPSTVTAGELSVTASGYGIAAYEGSIAVESSVPNYPEWDASKSYTSTDTVIFNGHIYTPKWWTSNTQPDLHSNGKGQDVWKDLGAIFVSTKPTVNASTNAGGSISPSGTFEVEKGTTVEFTATPDNGYIFDSFIINTSFVTSMNPYTLSNITEDTEIRAIFREDLRIQAYAGPNGEISSLGVRPVTRGETITYTITPAPGYEVAQLQVDGKDVEPALSYTFANITESHTIAVFFKPATRLLEFDRSYIGSIQWLSQDCDLKGDGYHTLGDIVNISISDSIDEVHRFVEWKVVEGTADIANPAAKATTVTITGNAKILPVLKRVHAIEAIAGNSDGTISNVGTKEYDEGTDVTFDITPNVGFEIAEVRVDGEIVTVVNNQFTFTNVTTAHQIVVYFKPAVRLLEFDRSYIGSIQWLSQDCDLKGHGYHKLSDIVNISISDSIDEVHRFVEWRVVEGSAEIANPTARATTVKITGNAKILPVLKRVHEIEAHAGNTGGSISGEGVNEYDEGKSAVFTITPDKGYEIAELQVDGVKVPVTGLTYTFDNVQEKHLIVVYFKQAIRSLQFDLDYIGSIQWLYQDCNLQGNGYHKLGDIVTISINDSINETHRFVRWELKSGTAIIANPTATSTTVEIQGTEDIIIEPVLELIPVGPQYEEWSSTKSYGGGSKVSYNGKNWEAKWWTQGSKPGVADVWKEI